MASSSSDNHKEDNMRMMRTRLENLQKRDRERLLRISEYMSTNHPENNTADNGPAATSSASSYKYLSSWPSWDKLHPPPSHRSFLENRTPISGFRFFSEQRDLWGQPVGDAKLERLIQNAEYCQQMPNPVDSDDNYASRPIRSVPDFNRIVIKDLQLEEQIENWLEVFDTVQFSINGMNDYPQPFCGEYSWMKGAEPIDIEAFRADRRELATQLSEHVNWLFFKYFMVEVEKKYDGDRKFKRCMDTYVKHLNAEGHRFLFAEMQECVELASADFFWIQLCKKIKNLWVEDGLLDSTACDNSLVYAKQLRENKRD